MTTEAIGVARTAETATSTKQPYSPSWVNVLTGWIDRLPGPAWVAYALLAVASATLANAAMLAAGLISAAPDLAQSYYGVLLPATIWLIHHLDGVARTSFDAFRPALDAPESAVARWRHEISVAPARPTAVLGILAVVLTLASYAGDPVGTQVDRLPPELLAARAFFEGSISALAFVLLYHAFRQLRLIHRLHRSATRIDLFVPAPLYAFSRLAAHTSVGIALLFLPGLLVSPLPTQTAIVTTAIYYSVIVAIVVVAFVLPLYGMHGRIATEKRRLQGEAGRRIEETVGELHAAIDAREFAQAGALNSVLGALATERETLRRLPTWPWEVGTLSAVVSAVLLPIGLWLATRLLERVV